ARERIGLLLHFRRLPRAGAEIVSAIHRDPRLHLLQVLEQHAAIDREVANDGKLRERLEGDGLLEFVDQRRARHLRLAVDEHGAGATNFFQAVRIVGDRRGRFAIARHRLGRNVHQGGSHVHTWPIRQLKFFPVGFRLGGLLAFDLDDYGFRVRHFRSSLFAFHRSKLSAISRQLSAKTRTSPTQRWTIVYLPSPNVNYSTI